MSDKELTPEEKTIQVLSSLVHAMEFELEKDKSNGHITQTAKALSHRIKTEYMSDKGITNFDDVEYLFHHLELTKVFRTAMVQLKQTWDNMVKKK